MSRCTHPDAQPSRFLPEGWTWCPDCERHIDPDGYLA